MARTTNPKARVPKCGWCGGTEEAVGTMVKGRTIKSLICVSCNKNINDFMVNQEKVAVQQAAQAMTVPTPRAMVEFLDKFIIGQDTAKRVMSVAVHNHYKRLLAPHFPDDDTEIDKSNVLLIGPTGSGKTLIAKTLARIVQVPFAIGDATTLTQAGYVGEDVENLILKLLMNADGNLQATESGIIYVDEIDKIASKNSNVSITRDVSGEGVQQSLLKLIEGTVANVPAQGGRKHPEAKYIPVNTNNILFICGGTFVGMKDIIAKRVNKKTIGFASDAKEMTENDLIQLVQSEDFVQYGIIPELTGRLPVVAPLKTLSEKDLLRVLQEPKNSIVRQYQKLFKMERCELEFTDDALLEVVRLAIKQETGARGLRNVLEGVMLDIMFSLPEQPKDKYVVTEKVVKGTEKLFGKEAA